MASDVPPAARRRFMLRAMPALFVFWLLTMILPWLLPQIEQRWLKVALVLPAVILVGVILLEMVQHVRSEDELRRREHMLAMTTAALVTCFLTFSWGMMETWLAAPALPVLLVLPLFCGIYGFGFMYAMRRYQ